MRRLLIILALVAGALVVPAPASAHSALVSASPGPGAKVAPGTRVIGLTFSPLRDTGPHRVSVAGPDDKPVAVGRPLLVDRTTLCLSVAELRQPGSYAVSYSTVAADGDPQQSRFSFQVLPSGQPPVTPAACAGRTLPAPSTTGTAVRARSNPVLTAVPWIGLIALIGMATVTVVATVRNRTRPSVG
jgi:methionine-rich copper-binding protein CopC